MSDAEKRCRDGSKTLPFSLGSKTFPVKQKKKNTRIGPGWVAQLVRALSHFVKVAGSIPSQGSYKNQQMNA